MILFVFPVITAALLGGLWPGLTSTTITIFTGFLITLFNSDSDAAAGDFGPFALLCLAGIFAGVLVSLVGEALYRSRQAGQSDLPANDPVVRLVRSSLADLSAEMAQQHDERNRALQDARLAAQQRDALYQRISDSLPSQVSYWDKDRRLKFANAPYLAFHGLIREAAIGKTLEENRGQSLTATDLTRLDAILQGIPQHFERSAPSDGPAPVHHLVDYIPDIREGAVIGFTLVASDITDIKAVEMSLRETQRQLEAALRQAEAATVAKSSFISNMSHELRTPLNAILGFAYLLGNSVLTSDQKSMLTKMQVAGEALLRLINDILDFTKIEASQVEAELSTFSLANLVAEAAALVAPGIKKKALDFTIGPLPMGIDDVVSDPLRVKQVLNHLLSNAVKFTERGEIGLNVTVVDRDFDKVILRFSISDTGIGIYPANHRLIFGEFSQADGSDSRRYGGSGLGLAISRRVVSLLGGDIGVDSTPGQGSTFWFTVPVGITARDAASPKHADAGRQRILIASDISFTRSALAEIAASLGLRVDIATSLTKAADHLSTTQMSGRKYEIVLADWRLPNCHAVATLRAAIERIDTKTRPCLLLVTAFKPDETTGIPEVDLADGILYSPLTPSRLQDAMARLHRRGVPPAAIAAPGPNRSATPQNQLAGTRVLICDDNELNSEVMRVLLEDQGGEVVIVDDGEAAVTWLIQHDDVDIVLMDIQMPKMNGCQATRIIRQTLGRQDLPIVAVSASVFQDQQDAAIDAGMNAFLRKPLIMEEVVPTIRRLVADYRAGHPIAPLLLSPPPATDVVATGTGATSAGAAASTPAITADRLAVFDVAAAVGRWLDTDALRHYLHRYLPLLATDSQRLAEFLGAANYDQLAVLAHKLRGTAGDFGLSAVCHSAGAVQYTARNVSEGRATPDTLAPLVNALHDDLVDGCAAIAAYLNDSQPSPESSDASEAAKENQGDVKALTATFQRLLDTLDSDSPQVVKPALAALAAAIGAKPLTAVSNHIDDFDFRQAEEKLRRLAATMNLQLAAVPGAVPEEEDLNGV